MSIGLVYWIIIVVSALFGVYSNWSSLKTGDLKTSMGGLIPLILFILIGWKLFGPPIHE